MDPVSSTPAPPPAGGLEALGGMAQEVDGANPSPEAKAKEAKKAEEAKKLEAQAAEWAQVPHAIGGAVCMIVPELAPLYAMDKCMEWGRSAALVSKKYGWDGPSALPEIALIGSTLGFAVPSFFAVRQRIKQIREGGQAGMFAKFVIWWQRRKADRAAKAGEPAPEPKEGAGDGGQQ